MRPDTTRFTARVLWCTGVCLALIGSAAALARGIFVADFAARMEPHRRQILESLRRDDPHARERAEEVARFDKRFAAHPLQTLMHVAPGGLLLLLAPFQFSSRVRSRFIAFHRWSGRLLVSVALATGASGLYFGLLMPYAGLREAVAIAIVGGLFLLAISLAVVAVRQHQLARHREWMIRAFAIAIGISTVRVVGAVIDVVLTPAGLRPEDVFVLAVWTGWAMTIAAAELWIRHTRVRSLAVPAGAAFS